MWCMGYSKGIPKRCPRCIRDRSNWWRIPKLILLSDMWSWDAYKNGLSKRPLKSVNITLCIWSNMLYSENFKILIWLPFFIKSFIWAAKCPNPLHIDWEVIEWGAFLKLLFLGSAPKLPSSAQAPASQSPAGGWDSLILTTVGNLHQHPTPGIVISPVSSLIITTVGTCSWLVKNLFKTCLWLAYNLFRPFS